VRAPDCLLRPRRITERRCCSTRAMIKPFIISVIYIYTSGMIDQAIDLYTRSININAKRADAFLQSGVSYTIKNQQREALADLNKAIELKQDFDMAYFSPSQLYSRIGQRTSAVADYEKACSLGYQAACQELAVRGHL